MMENIRAEFEKWVQRSHHNGGTRHTKEKMFAAYKAATEAARGDITQSYGQRFEAWWSGRHPQMRNWPDHSVAWSAYKQGLRDAKLDAKTDRSGDMVSVDVSTCDEDAGHRVFASLTGEFNDGFWIADLDHFNYATEAAPVVPEGWLLVPASPTPEMMEAALEAHMPFGDMQLAITMANFSAPEHEQ